jgi:hypothetical protein
VYALLDEALTWFAALPGAALIVREREGQTWDILRSTPLEGAQIALNKLGGVLYLIWESVGYVASARWYGTLLALPLLALMLTLSNPFPFAPHPSSWLGLLIIYFTFIYRPQLNLLYGGSLGLAVSALCRTTGEALAWVTILSGATLMAGVLALIWFQRLNGAAPFFSESVLAARLESIFIWLIPLGILTLLRCALTPLCLWLAIGRLPHLND